MSQVNAHAADTSARTSRQRWYALLVCMAGGFIVFLDVSIVNVALPTISRQLHASGSLLQWLVSGYSLAFGLVLVPAGRLGDIMGHRMLFVTGLAAFVAASAVCGAAPTAAVLVTARIAQVPREASSTRRSAPPSSSCSRARSEGRRSAISPQWCQSRARSGRWPAAR